MQDQLIENQGGHGAIQINRVHRKIRKAFRPKIGGGMVPFDWVKGYDVRDTVGPIKIKNQGINFSCGGQAGSYFLQIQRKIQNIQEGELSARSIYSPISFKGGGTTVNSLITQIAAKGADLETEVPSYDVTGAPLSEAGISGRGWVTPDLTARALKRAGYTPYDIGESIEEVAETIRDYGGVIFEVHGQNNGTWTSAFPVPPSKSNPMPLWGHFMCAIGAKMIGGKKYIIALQSEGEGWGDKGVQYFSEDYFKSGYIVDAFTFIYDTKLVPLPNNHTVWADVLRWFVSYFSSPAFAT